MCKPWLQRSHPNLFIAVLVTLVRQSWAGVNGFVIPGLFNTPSFKYTNQAASPRVWGFAALISAVIIGVGLFRPTFTLTRKGLTLALVLTTAQLVFLARAAWSGIPVGNGLPNYLFIAVLILTQTLEPPVNPASARHNVFTLIDLEIEKRSVMAGAV